MITIEKECGAVIYVGKNARENDELFKNRNETDTWFHLNSLPSAHVWLVIPNSEKPTKSLIIECAQLVKDNSKCSVSKISISYLEKRFLFKKKNTSAGTVFLKKSPNIIKL